MTQGSFQSTMTTHFKDLRGIYAKRMECHGVGMALMQPISGDDCQPVSCGYFDRNGDWNLITRLTADNPGELDDYFYPLEYQPKAAAPVEITWQPKTSLGVSALTVDASGETPDGLPVGAGADVHIKYSSNSKFGAVLMTTKPVTLRAYNDEALLCSWLSRNQGKLYDRYGPELKRYGLWIVTRTYATQRASINAWMDKNRDQTVSLKAKAAMLGELGEDLDWRDKASDKDWSHYAAKSPRGVVVFIDGIEVPPRDWWLEGLRAQLASSASDRGRRLLRYMPDPVRHQATFDTHRWGMSLQQIDRESAQLQRAAAAAALEAQPRRRSLSAALSPRRRSAAASSSASPPPPPEVLRRRPSDQAAAAFRQEPEQHKRLSSAAASAQLRPDSGVDLPKARDWHPHAAHPPAGLHASVHSAHSHDSAYEFHSRPAALPQHARRKPSGGVRGLAEAPPVDDETLKDAGLSGLSRASSIRCASAAPSIRSQRSVSRSLRRETRSISHEPE